MQRSACLAAARLELLPGSDLDLTSKNPSHPVQLWILGDYRFEGADVFVPKYANVIMSLSLCVLFC